MSVGREAVATCCNMWFKKVIPRIKPFSAMGSHQPWHPLKCSRSDPWTLSTTLWHTILSSHGSGRTHFHARLLILSQLHTWRKVYDCIMHGFHHQTDRNINTWQNSQNRFCVSSCYNRWLQEHIVPLWHTQAQTVTNWKTSLISTISNRWNASVTLRYASWKNDLLLPYKQIPLTVSFPRQMQQ